MSDHEHEHDEDQPQAFSFFLGPSKEQMEQAQMEHDANAHETLRFFESLDVEQLGKLSAIIHAIVRTDGMAGAYYQGVINTLADTKFKRCAACGKNHEQEARDLLTPPDAPVEPAETSPPMSDAPAVKGTKKYDELMYLYNMEQDDDGSDRVMCKGCGVWSIDLADRMLRDPGVKGCAGCQQKTKWG